MPISLSKGQNVSLSKADPGMTKVLVGLGWDVRATTGDAFDLDASALLLGADDKVRTDADFVFYGNLKHESGAVEHRGDNKTGSGEGDDETVFIDLSLVPDDVQKVVISVSIHEADARGQNFGQVRNAYVRLVNEDSGVEAIHYDLVEEASTETALNFAEVYRNNGEWKFRAVGQGYATGLAGIATDFGVNIG